VARALEPLAVRRSALDFRRPLVAAIAAIAPLRLSSLEAIASVASLTTSFSCVSLDVVLLELAARRRLDVARILTKIVRVRLDSFQ
jgi:hypothetical protein